MTNQSVSIQPGRIRRRERDAIVASLRAGMVPRVGQQHIQVGRAAEVQAAAQDIDRIAGGGAGCRFIIGEYGSGKTFFLNLVRSVALEKRLVTVHAARCFDLQIRTLRADVMEDGRQQTRIAG